MAISGFAWLSTSHALMPPGLVHHGRHEIGLAVLARRVLGGATEKGEPDGDQRICMAFHEPRLDAAGARNFLNLHTTPLSRGGRGQKNDRRQRSRKPNHVGEKQRANRHPGYDFLPMPAAWAGSSPMLLVYSGAGVRMPVTALCSTRCGRATARMSSTVTCGNRSGHSSTSSTDMPAASRQPYWRAMRAMESEVSTNSAIWE